MALVLSDYANALTKVLLPYIRDNFPKNTILLDQLKRNSGVTQLNNAFYAPIRTSRMAGVSSLAADSSSVALGAAALGQGSVAVKIHTGAFDISKLAIDATKGNNLAVENALTSQAKFLTSDFARNINRQMYDDGVGAISQVSGSVDGTSWTVLVPNASLDDGRSIDHYGSVNGDIDPTKYIVPGQVIGVGSGGAVVATVLSVSRNSNQGGVGTVYVTGTMASAANDTVYLLDGSGIGAGSSEMGGVRAALSSTTGTSTYAGVARSTTGWQPAFGSVSEALTMSRLENTYLQAKEYSQGGDQYAIFMNKTLYKKYGDLLVSMRRQVNETDLLGGWTGLEFSAGAGKVGVFLDYEVPDGEVEILNLDSWTICQVDDLNWMESPNEGSLLRLANKIQYQAIMVWFANLMCLAPGANGRLTQKTA